MGARGSLPYTRSDAKDWARETWRGVCNVLLPTFRSDFKGLNRAAIVHDLHRCAADGFWGTLLVSECGTTLDEMREFIDIAVENRPPGFHLVLHGSFDTLADTVELSRYAAERGVEALLLAYPGYFYPESAEEVYHYTAEVAEATDQALILFAVGHWGYRRLDPRGFPLEALERMAALPTAVALKCEIGQPGNAAMGELQAKIGDRILICDPMEAHAPGWIRQYGMPWMGTSNYEYTGGAVPRIFALMQEGRWDEAMAQYWAIQPAREAKQALHASFPGAHLIHRPAWKYMAWLVGYNGGPLRMPQMRLTAPQMRALRQGLVASGISVTEEPDRAFFEGRISG